MRVPNAEEFSSFAACACLKIRFCVSKLKMPNRKGVAIISVEIIYLFFLALVSLWNYVMKGIQRFLFNETSGKPSIETNSSQLQNGGLEDFLVSFLEKASR